MIPESPYRTEELANRVIAFSAAYQRENLLARGMGLEHLKELLERLGRPILRNGGNLAYGGDWVERPENFTYHLLEIVKAEQEDGSRGGTGSPHEIGKLYCHAAWPHYVKIQPYIEARWINSCRIVRFTQEDAGIPESDVVADAAETKGGRAAFNAAVTLSAMRRLVMQERKVEIPDIEKSDIIPPVVARILLGGKESGYSGFLPGIFEETLATYEAHRPIYLLGGFGGATQLLADAILGTGDERPKELTLKWQLDHTPALGELQRFSRRYTRPKGVETTDALLDAVFDFVRKARTSPAKTLQTGLDEPETRVLMQTHDIATAVRLVHKGLRKNMKIISTR